MSSWLFVFICVFLLLMRLIVILVLNISCLVLGNWLNLKLDAKTSTMRLNCLKRKWNNWSKQDHIKEVWNNVHFHAPDWCKHVSGITEHTYQGEEGGRLLLQQYNLTTSNKLARALNIDNESLLTKTYLMESRATAATA